MSRLSMSVLLGCAVVLSACQGGDVVVNPSALDIQTLPPPPTAALMFTSDAWSSEPSGREVFAVDRSGAGLTRLTFCNTLGPCDYAEVSPARDRTRLMARRFRDLDDNGRIDPTEGAELAYVDLARGVEAATVAAGNFVTGVDWFSLGGVVLYTAQGPTRGASDLFRQDTDGQNIQGLGTTPAIDERLPRFDPTGRAAAFERLAADGRRVATLFFGSAQQFPLTEATAGEGTVDDGAYRVGSDANPTFSPSGGEVVFRRLRAVGSDGRGEWDIVIVPSSTLFGAERVIATGPAFRGAPDWSSDGIVFPESDPGSPLTRIVVVQPDGTGRDVPVTVPARVSSLRWLVPPS